MDEYWCKNKPNRDLPPFKSYQFLDISPAALLARDENSARKARQHLLNLEQVLVDTKETIAFKQFESREKAIVSSLDTLSRVAD